MEQNHNFRLKFYQKLLYFDCLFCLYQICMFDLQQRQIWWRIIYYDEIENISSVLDQTSMLIRTRIRERVHYKKKKKRTASFESTE